MYFTGMIKSFKTAQKGAKKHPSFFLIAGSALLSLILLFALSACNGNGGSADSDGTIYRSDASSGSSSGSQAGAGSFSVSDLLSHANAGDTSSILSYVGQTGTDSGEASEIRLSAADIGLPSGGSVRLCITGDNYSYDESMEADEDGYVSFRVPYIAEGTVVTVVIEVKDATGTVVCSGSKTQVIQEGEAGISITLSEGLASEPEASEEEEPEEEEPEEEEESVPEGFVLVEGDGSGIPNLYVCSHEVTQGEYVSYCSYGEDSPSEAKGLGSDYPAYFVSWYDALVYCNKRSIAEGLTPCYTIGENTDPDLWEDVPTDEDETWDDVSVNTSANGYRLPTEAEWLWAANGGTAPESYIYAGSDDIEEVAWYSDNSGDDGGTSNKKSHEVMTKAPNSLELYDMSGNVAEWCGSRSVSGDTSSNPVVRGGGWSYPANYSMLSKQSNHYAYGRLSALGFRVVRKAN